MLEARYDEAMVFSDYYSGPFLQRVLQLLGPNTAIVVTADHGESFSHSYGAHTGPGLYNEITNIPLILKLPGETAGRRCDDVVQQADIAPTLAALAGVPAPASWPGRSLVDACAPGAADPVPTRPIFTMNFEQNPRFAALRTGSVAVIEGRWKLIHYMGKLHYPFMPALHDELYDVVSDPERAARSCRAAARGGAAAVGPDQLGAGATRRAGDTGQPHRGADAHRRRSRARPSRSRAPWRAAR